MRGRLLNPYSHKPHDRMGPREKNILRLLAAGRTLVGCRHYIEERDTYAVSWYWDIDDGPPWSEDEWDGPVMMLLGRQAIRPVTCAGGRTTMVMTPAGKRKARALVRTGITRKGSI